MNLHLKAAAAAVLLLSVPAAAQPISLPSNVSAKAVERFTTALDKQAAALERRGMKDRAAEYRAAAAELRAQAMARSSEYRRLAQEKRAAAMANRARSTEGEQDTTPE